jgi:2-(1,2-epoxy-1,2-dihydrophenyl)acetyl-CoA isomerase
MSESTYETVRLEGEGAVGVVTLDRPNHLNSLTQQLTEELLDAVTVVTEDDDVRCVVLRGAGSGFGAGADLSQFEGDGRDESAIRQLASTLHESLHSLCHADKPVVSGIDGTAAGAGFSMALCADVVLVSDDARLQYAYPQVGLTGDGGSTFFLPRLVGLRRAKEIALMDEPIEPAEAVDLGLATEVVPSASFDDRLDEVARELASGPTEAFGEMKRLLTESFDRTLEGQLAAETNAIARATRTEDYSRGHAAFECDDDPEFVGR